MTFYIAPAGTLPDDVAAWTDISDAVTDVDFSFEESANAIADYTRLANYTFEASFSITMTRREHRRAITSFQRMLRRPALIHNGRKPRV